MLSGKPRGPHKIQGIGAGFIPSILDSGLIDEIITVSSETAFEMSRLVAKVEGIPGGISTGANVAAALAVAERPEYAGKTIVTFAPSSAERYYTSDSSSIRASRLEVSVDSSRARRSTPGS